MKVRAISLWQPWASLMAVGAKWIETRSWDTGTRGVVMIHAAKTTKGLQLVRDGDARIRRAMERAFGVPAQEWGDWLPRGAIIARSELVDSIPGPEALERYPAQDPFGDFSAGRYAHLYPEPVAIEPIPCRGRQGFFWVEMPDPGPMPEGVVQ